MDFYIIFTGYYIIVNVIAFVLYGVDKAKAIAQKNRIPERTLIFTAFLGGGIGALLGMILFRHKIRKIKFKIWVPVWLVVHVAIIFFCMYQNNHLVETYYDYDGNGVECRIVQVSDLHSLICWFDKDYIPKRIAKLNPDIIVITGDIVDSLHTNIDTALYTSSKLAQITDTYYITGNHEYNLSQKAQDKLFEGLTSNGIRILNDEFVTIDKYGMNFNLIGISDISLRNYKMENIIKDIKVDNPNILNVVLAHEPQYFDEYVESEADLILTGHAHGGQFILPVVGPFIAPDQSWPPKYTSGVFNRNNTTMIISRGLGNSIIPVRLFNYPEVVVVDIK